jgi:hypothetical protein
LQRPTHFIFLLNGGLLLIEKIAEMKLVLLHYQQIENVYWNIESSRKYEITTEDGINLPHGENVI